MAKQRRKSAKKSVDYETAKGIVIIVLAAAIALAAFLVISGKNPAMIQPLTGGNEQQ